MLATTVSYQLATTGAPDHCPSKASKDHLPVPAQIAPRTESKHGRYADPDRRRRYMRMLMATRRAVALGLACPIPARV